jgi:serine/threonine protein phosphatase 1
MLCPVDPLPAPRQHHWVIGDVHGCDRSLVSLLAVLPSDDHLVFCGDVINRGGGIEAAMDLVWTLVRLGRATWLRGNHEQDLIDALESSGDGSAEALFSQDTVRQLGERRTRSWLDRLQQLPLKYSAEGWSATHAGFNSDGQPDLSIREPFWESYDGRHGRVVIGHTPRPTVERHQRIVLVDTGAVYGGLLSAYCPETDAVVQVQGSGDGCLLPRPDDPHRVPDIMAGDATSC